jgi:hypothetical protein
LGYNNGDSYFDNGEEDEITVTKYNSTIFNHDSIGSFFRMWEKI